MGKEDTKLLIAGNKAPKSCDAYKDGFCEENAKTLWYVLYKQYKSVYRKQLEIWRRIDE